MYVNKCTKCGKEFETKNPKRVICPECLYPERKPLLEGEEQPKEHKTFYTSDNAPYQKPRGNFDRPQGQRPYGQRPQGQGGYNRPQGGGYNRQDGGGYNRQGGGQRPYQQRQGGYDRPQGGYNRPQGGGGYNRQGQGGGFNKPRFNKQPKQLLVSKEQVAQIEELYKRMLPLPNPNAHEVIGEIIALEPRKVFFGINLVRQKMMLPKLPFPKRKLAVSPDQLTAIKMLYEPLLPLPPIGCHKILAAQLKMDEWRVHVGIGLVRKQLGLERWITDRADAPEQFKKQ